MLFYSLSLYVIFFVALADDELSVADEFGAWNLVCRYITDCGAVFLGEVAG